MTGRSGSPEGLALDRFAALLDSRASEAEFQRLFSDYPFILSKSLPLRLEPADIRPLGRPGRSEPDFVIFPHTHTPLSRYGIIEIKRPDSSIIQRPRKGITILSRDADTALKQAQAYADEFLPALAEAHQSFILGNRTDLFLVMGMSAEIAERVGLDLASSAHRLLPDNCQIIPYDVLFRTFHESVPPPRIHVLLPDLSHARASASGPMAKLCPLHHLNPADSVVCRVCEASLSPEVAFPVERPTTGVLRLPDRSVVPLDANLVVGRLPDVSQLQSARTLIIRDDDGSVSRSHCAFEVHGWNVTICDLGSTNGTAVETPRGGVRRLPSNRPTKLLHGMAITLADVYTMYYDLSA